MSPKLSSCKLPIGVFDSGLGGLTVVKAMRKRLKQESLVYFGDTARVPYGTKSKQSVIRFSHENSEVLLKHKVKMIVVACNTSSSWAIHQLRKTYDIPILGVIEPGAAKAAAITHNKRVGVIATPSTIKSGSYQKHIKKYNASINVYTQSCPLFVPLAEEGWYTQKITEDIARTYLAPLKAKKIDTLILGCTHYPLLKKVIQKVMGKRVTLVDSADEISLSVKDLLMGRDLLNASKRSPSYQFLVSDDPSHFKPLASKFLGRPVTNIRQIFKK